jgi:hypothetical protein
VVLLAIDFLVLDEGSFLLKRFLEMHRLANEILDAEIVNSQCLETVESHLSKLASPLSKYILLSARPSGGNHTESGHTFRRYGGLHRWQ